ncbi:MAG TPA: hypothetical protein VKB26_06680 [Candidatus Acidoferrales bacterium]|nr:hypothetical protein [Candidatus Acidoferrales bacterium]
MPHTAFLAKLIGLFSLIVAVLVGINKNATLVTVGGIVQSAEILMVLGFISLAVGLAIVLSHNVWRKGLLALVVTLGGWVFLLRGVMVLALPHQQLVALLNVADYQQLFYVYVVIALIIGAYLTIGGFRRAQPKI